MNVSDPYTDLDSFEDRGVIVSDSTEMRAQKEQLTAMQHLY